MTTDIIEKYVENKDRKNAFINVHFKERNMVSGLFVQGTDYEELKHKNFWRIVSKANAKDWKETKNINLARLYNGGSFTRLSDDKS
jgi:hypothetical protein